jgi:hypothetical protein
MSEDEANETNQEDNQTNETTQEDIFLNNSHKSNQKSVNKVESYPQMCESDKSMNTEELG